MSSSTGCPTGSSRTDEGPPAPHRSHDRGWTLQEAWRRGYMGAMVLPGGTSDAVPLSIAPNDLRQLADHDAGHRTFAGCAGPLIALNTGPADGATVLLVAGYTGSKEDFAPLLRPLGNAGYRAVALDQRGQFESPGPDDPAAYTVDELAADVLAVLRALREEDGDLVHLVGHSFGGIVSRGAVLADPSAVTSLTLLGSGPSGLTGRRAQ